MNVFTPKIPTVLGILYINSPFVPSIDPRYLRVARIEYLQTSLTMLDGEVDMVGDGEREIVVEDRKIRLVCAQNLLKLMEHDIESDDHAP
jgi:hypothetical protein